MIQAGLLEQVAAYALSRIARAEYVSNGTAQPANIYLKDIEDGTRLRVWVTIPSGVPQVSEVKVYDPDDTVVLWQIATFTPTPGRVTYVRFEIDTKEMSL